MQFQLRKNPPTTGWARRGAIAALIGLASFIISLPISFFLFLNHFEAAYPKDTQNLLSALTASVVLGLGLALLAIAMALIISVLLSRLHSTSAA